MPSRFYDLEIDLPAVELKASKEFRREFWKCSLRWRGVVQPNNVWTHGDEDATAAWARGCRELATRAARGDDEALFLLIKRDPRYLASELVAAKVLFWKLTIQQAKVTRARSVRGSGKYAGTTATRKATLAKANLRKLANAISFVTGRKKSFVPGAKELLKIRDLILKECKDMLKLLKAKKRVEVDEDGDRWRYLDESAIDGLKANPRSVKTTALQLLADQYELSVERVQKLLTAANKRRAEVRELRYYFDD